MSKKVGNVNKRTVIVFWLAFFGLAVVLKDVAQDLY